MFRHIGATRTLQHNLQIATLLSFVAGMVNVGGFLAVQRMTTNITGHFAFLIDEVFKLNWTQGIVYLLYVLFFLLGAFVASFIVELTYRWNKHYIYVFPALLESILLFATAAFGAFSYGHPDFLACWLLFAMGLQNSLVTNISKSVVRTTHLTGLFTDLGIELAQLLFNNPKEKKKKILSSIRLRLTIIISFFFGGLSSGLLYPTLSLQVLTLAALILVFGATFDYIKYGVLKIKRKYSPKKQ